MPQTSNFILPYEPEYTGHREEEKRREETREWLRQRKRELESPSMASDWNSATPSSLQRATSPSIRQDCTLSAFTASKIQIARAPPPAHQTRWLVAPRLGWPVVDAAGSPALFRSPRDASGGDKMLDPWGD